MNLELRLDPELEGRLRERAAQEGKAPEEYALEAVTEKLSRPTSFDEILAPVRAAVQASDMLEVEIDSALEDALAESRAGRRRDGE